MAPPGGAVVRRGDADDLIAEAGDLAARPLLSVGRQPVGGVVFRQRLVAGSIERRVDAISDQARGRVGRRAVDLQHARAFGNALGLEMVHERLRNGPADPLIIEGDIVVGRHVGDRTVIGDDLDALAMRLLDQRGGGARVDGVEHDHLGALGDHRVELLLLKRGIGVGVLVDHRAGRAELLHLGLEAGVVVLLVARRALVRHQEGHGGTLSLGQRGGSAK